MQLLQRVDDHVTAPTVSCCIFWKTIQILYKICCVLLRLGVSLLQSAQFAEENMCKSQVDSILYQLSNTALPGSASHAHPASVPPSIHKHSSSWKTQHALLPLLTLFLCCSKHARFHLFLSHSGPIHSRWHHPGLILSHQLLQSHHLPVCCYSRKAMKAKKEKWPGGVP